MSEEILVMFRTCLAMTDVDLAMSWVLPAMSEVF